LRGFGGVGEKSGGEGSRKRRDDRFEFFKGMVTLPKSLPEAIESEVLEGG